MGLGGRKPVLPAPTESLVDESTVGEVEEDTGPGEDEVATDLSQRTDRTHHTIPEDGSPITISTSKPTAKTSKITQGNQSSQTSLLIEYFEAGKSSDPNRRPSVRVKVIPSSRNKNSKAADGHIVLTEARADGTGRKSTSRRISLGSSNPQVVPVGSDISLLPSRETVVHRRNGPVDIEIKQNSDLSEMSSSPEVRYITAPSDISSMPADSMLGLQQSTVFAPPQAHYAEGSNVSSVPAEESVLSVSEVHEPQTLKPPSFPKERSTSNERITQKVIEKLSTRPRAETRPIYNSSSKSTSRSGSRDITITGHDRATQKAKNFRETDSTLSPTEVSGFSHSALSLGNKSDASIRSGTSNNNINNPKLLQTVEDAIRRLILPELKELKKENKELKKDNVRRSISGEKPRRRRSSKDYVERSGSSRRRGSQQYDDYDSLSDSSSLREASISSISNDDPKRYARSRRVQEGAAAGLTAAALEARESEESMHKRRRKKRSKSRSSQSASIVESEETFQKHRVPPMPMRSEIDSELTRSSILSSNTATSQTPLQYEVREVARGSPARLLSPITTSPPRHSADLRQVLGTHHGNFSEHNLSSQRLAYEQPDVDPHSPESDRYHSFSAEDLVLEDPERMRQYERNLHTQHPIRRGLSPIQSVASYQTTEPNRHSMFRKSADSMASTKRRQQQLKEEVSISSLVTPSPSLRKSRPQGISLENPSEILHHVDNKSENIHRSPEYQSIGVHDRFVEDDHDYNRDSWATSEHSMDKKRISQVTDTSYDSQYVDQVTAGQHVVPVIGARPEIVPAPFGVESGVASLVEPSVLSMKESQSSHKGSFVHERASVQSLPRDLDGARMTSPSKGFVSIKSDASLGQNRHRAVDLSPPQSPARSYEDMHQGAYVHENQRFSSSRSVSPSGVKDEVKGSPESELVTNPSVIQGPIGGAHAGHDSWLPGSLTPPLPNQGGMSRDFTPGATDLIPEGLNVSQRNTYESKSKTYVIGQSAPTQALAPVGIKDEGYATGEGDHFPSPAPLMKTGPTAIVPYDLDDDLDDRLDDPFTSKKNQYVSGMSQGLSPLYEPATGKGMDRIQSNDIMHLMQHLTVRDAQRNARDTEILVTLVRSAAEMRNSFEDMKNFIAEQDAMILDTADKQHEHTQKVVGGPRSMPSAGRSVTMSQQEDLPTKRRNVFKRALQGLGSKNTVELHNIESMLMQLLDEVEALRSQQVSQAPMSQARTDSMNSIEAGRPATDTGYEPEGRAGTASSGGERSFMLSNNSSRQNQFSAARRVPENRVSTVMEGDEEIDSYANTRQVSDNQRTPRATSPSAYYVQRGQSEPLHTPPRMHDEDQTTPTTYTSSDRKHKTFSSFLPNPKQFVSRWSKTTASTEPEYRQSTQSKPRPYSQVSKSGSNLHEWEYENNPDDRLRSATSLQNEEYYRDQENRPPSPLMPSTLSDNPKYQAHRNSQNLIHPQPRQGPTGRNQFRLENAAQSYHNDEAMSPVSQTSSNRWAGMDTRQAEQTHIPQSMSPISDAGSMSSLTRRNNGPPRPPRINESEISEPLFPQRPSKMGTMSPSTYVDEVRAARAGSPAFDKSPVMALRSPNNGNMARKPSGPRPLSASSNKESLRKARFNESPSQQAGNVF